MKKPILVMVLSVLGSANAVTAEAGIIQACKTFFSPGTWKMPTDLDGSMIRVGHDEITLFESGTLKPTRLSNHFSPEALRILIGQPEKIPFWKYLEHFNQPYLVWSGAMDSSWNRHLVIKGTHPTLGEINVDIANTVAGNPTQERLGTTLEIENDSSVLQNKIFLRLLELSGLQITAESIESGKDRYSFSPRYRQSIPKIDFISLLLSTSLFRHTSLLELLIESFPSLKTSILNGALLFEGQFAKKTEIFQVQFFPDGHIQLKLQRDYFRAMEEMQSPWNTLKTAPSHVGDEMIFSAPVRLHYGREVWEQAVTARLPSDNDDRANLTYFKALIDAVRSGDSQ